MANGIKRGPWALGHARGLRQSVSRQLSASHPIPIHWALGKGEGGKQSKARTAGGDWLRVGRLVLVLLLEPWGAHCLGLLLLCGQLQPAVS